MSMESHLFIKNVLKIAFNLGETSSFLPAWNVIVKHSYEDEKALCLFEVAIRSRGFIMVELDNVLDLEEKIRECVRKFLVEEIESK